MWLARASLAQLIKRVLRRAVFVSEFSKHAPRVAPAPSRTDTAAPSRTVKPSLPFSAPLPLAPRSPFGTSFSFFFCFLASLPYVLPCSSPRAFEPLERGGGRGWRDGSGLEGALSQSAAGGGVAAGLAASSCAVSIYVCVLCLWCLCCVCFAVSARGRRTQENNSDRIPIRARAAPCARARDARHAPARTHTRGRHTPPCAMRRRLVRP